MNKIVWLIMCILILPNVLSMVEHECEVDDDCLYNFLCSNEKCVHRGYFPPNLSQILLMLVMCALSMVATSAGVGGGAIYSALLMFIENFSAQVAFPISNFVILVCSVLTFYLGVKDKMIFPEHKFVDYDIVVIFCPTLLLGTKVGVILNKIFPQLLLNLLLIVCIAFSTYKIYKNAVKVKAKEESERQQAVAETPFQWKDEDDVIRPVRKLTIRSDSSSRLLDPSPIRDRLVPREKEEDELSRDEFILKQIDLFYSYNSPIRLVRIKMIVLMETIMVVDQLIEGSDKVPSIFGIKKCSFIYWFVFILFAIICIAFAKEMHKKVKEDSKDVKRISLTRNEGFNIGSSENDKQINFIILICFCAGIVSGMLGVGGGIIMAPLMLELGIEPQVTTSTSNFLLMFTSSAATVLFILSGQLMFKIGIIYASLCGIAATIGSSYINEYITKTKRASILIWILFYVMAFSLVILPLNGIRHAVYDISKGIDVFGFRSFC